MNFTSQVYTAASGSIGGVTYSHNAGGMYTRARAIPTNPNSPAQQAVRSAISNASTAWAALTPTNKALWDAYAASTPVKNKLGAWIFLSGRVHFLRSYVQRAALGVPMPADAPVTMGLTNLTDPVATITAPTTLSLAYTNTDTWAGAVGGFLFVYASRPQPPTVNFFKGPYRYSGAVAGAVVPPVSPMVMTLPFPCAATQRVFLRAIANDAEGRLSEACFLFDVAA